MLNLDKKRQDLLTNLWDALVQALLDRIQSGDATAGDLSVARHVCKDAGLRPVSESRRDFEQSLEGLPDFGVPEDMQ